MANMVRQLRQPCYSRISTRMSIALAILLRYTNRDPYAGSLYEPRILVRAEQRDAAGHLAEPRAAGENSPTFQDFI